MAIGEFEELVLEALQSRITRILPAQVLSCVEELNEAQLWWRPNETSNSVGNLVLHLSGSMRHYIAKTVGEIEYARNRRAEFDERGPLPKAEVIAIFREMLEQVAQVLGDFDRARLLDATP